MLEILEAIWPMIVVAVGGGWGAFKWLISRKDQKSNDEELEQIADLKATIQKITRDMSLLYFHMNQIINRTDAVKVIILKAHNGGGTPRIGANLYSTVLNEISESTEVPIMDRWQKQPLNEGYIAMLVNLFALKTTTLVADEMKPGPLKDVYTTQGFTFSKVLEIAATDTEYFYMSIIFRKPVDELTAVERDEIRAHHLAIQQIFRLHEGRI